MSDRKIPSTSAAWRGMFLLLIWTARQTPSFRAAKESVDGAAGGELVVENRPW
jgi:hypothetical protein